MPDQAFINNVLRKIFPEALPEREFVLKTYSAFSKFGFRDKNTIACVGVCRDEFTNSLIQAIQLAWGETFDLSSLAGMLFLGKTGFIAAHTHSPIVNGRERYIYYVLPHIAVSSDGRIGSLQRPGIDAPSTACGALLAFQAELARGAINLDLNFDDLEQSLLKRKLMARIPPESVPDLLSLTRTAHDIILNDLEHMVSLTVDPEKSDYAIVSGIHVHGPDANYISPGSMYAVVQGERKQAFL